MMDMLAREPEGEPGRHDKGDGQGYQHADARIDRYRTHVRPHQPGHESHRQERRDNGQGGEDGGTAHLVHRLGYDLGQGSFREQPPSVDVLHHHDRIVDQDAYRKNQCEQGNPVQGEPPGPGCEKRGKKGEHHRDADDHGFAAAQRDPYQHHHGRGGEDQLLDQLDRLVIGRHAVIARHRDFHAGRNHAALELPDSFDQLLRHLDRVFAGLFRYGEGHRGMLARLAAYPHVMLGLVRTVHDLRHIAHENRPAPLDTDHKASHVVAGREECAGLDQHFAIVPDQISGGLGGIGKLQRIPQVFRRKMVGIHPVRIHQHPDHVPGASYGPDLPDACHALQFDFRGMRHLLELEGTLVGVSGPESEGQDGNIVYPYRLDDRLGDAQIGGDPVFMRIDRVVQLDERLYPVLADLELHGENGHPGAGHRIDMIDPGDLGKHLLGGSGDEMLDVARGSPGKGNEHVRHGDVDLRFFFPRRHDHGKKPEQHRNQRDQRSQLGMQEEFADAARYPHVIARFCLSRP